MFYQPKDIQKALELKAELKERASFIAGGTDIVVLMNHGKAARRLRIEPGNSILARVRS